MCSSSTGDHPFNITWLKNHQIIYNSNLNSPHGAGVRNQKLHAGTLSSMSSSSVGDEDNAGGMHSRKHENSYFVDSTINISDYPPYSSILTIENLTSYDNGNYTCQISNHGGVVEHTAVLSVAGLYIFRSYFCKFHSAPLHQTHQFFHQTAHSSARALTDLIKMYFRTNLRIVYDGYVIDKKDGVDGKAFCCDTFVLSMHTPKREYRIMCFILAHVLAPMLCRCL